MDKDFLTRLEERSAEALFDAPHHPYTAALLAAMPERSVGESRLATIPGVVPGLYDRPTGCLFAPRCSIAKAGACDTRPEGPATGMSTEIRAANTPTITNR